jgi:hypothetical protein
MAGTLTWDRESTLDTNSVNSAWRWTSLGFDVLEEGEWQCHSVTGWTRMRRKNSREGRRAGLHVMTDVQLTDFGRGRWRLSPKRNGGWSRGRSWRLLRCGRQLRTMYLTSRTGSPFDDLMGTFPPLTQSDRAPGFIWG